ncbi:hypothetical protein ACFVOR_24740 [Streptomyces sp. NPDC057837]
MSALAQDLTSADLDDLVERMRAGRLDELPPDGGGSRPSSLRLRCS